MRLTNQALKLGLVAILFGASTSTSDAQDQALPPKPTPSGEVQQATAILPIVKAEGEERRGVIRLITPPRVATVPKREPLKPVETPAPTERPSNSPGPAPRSAPPAPLETAGQSSPSDVPVVSQQAASETTTSARSNTDRTSTAARPIKTMRSPLVVRRTARLAIEIDVEETSPTKKTAQVTVRNEGPQPAGRTQLVLTVPRDLKVSSAKPSADDRQDLADARRLIYDLDGLGAADEMTVFLEVQSRKDVRGLIHAVIETRAEASKVVQLEGDPNATTAEQLPVNEIPKQIIQAAPAPPRSTNLPIVKSPAPIEQVPIARPGQGTAFLVNGPTRAQVGATVVYSLSLENLAQRDLGAIEIRTVLPDGVYLEGRKGLKLTDELKQGTQRSMDVAIRIQDSGSHAMRFQAWHNGELLASETVEVEAVKTDLKAGMGGPKSWNVGKEATFVIDLECRGTEPLKDVVVTLELPENIRITTVEHEAGYDSDRRLMAWRIVELTPGTTVKLRYKAVGLKAGESVQGLIIKTPDLGAPLRTSLTSQIKNSIGFRINGNLLRR